MKIADGELRQLLQRTLKYSPADLRELVADSKQTGMSLLHTLLASKTVDEVALAKAWAKKLGVPFIDLASTPIKKKDLQRLPAELARKHRVVCFEETKTSIKLAMDDPNDEVARQAVKDYTGKAVRRYLATSRDLARVMRHYSRELEPTPLRTRELVMAMLAQAWRGGSREIHLEPNGKELLVRQRVGRELRTLTRLPAARRHAVAAWLKLQAGCDIKLADKPQSGRFNLVFDEAAHTVIVHTAPLVTGEKLLVRIVPPAASIPSLHDMGYTFGFPQVANRGLVVISGSVQTHVASLLASLTKLAGDQPLADVVSIEDPQYYTQATAQQIEVDEQLGLGQAIGAALATGPAVVVVPRLGNGESAESLIDYALSRHLVMAGGYGRSLQATVEHLRRLPVAPALLAASLRVIATQHVLDKVCPKCRLPLKVGGPLATAIKHQLKLESVDGLYRKGPGCSTCHGGTNGQVFAYEYLEVTPALQQLLAGGADQRTIADWLAEHNDVAARIGELAKAKFVSVDDATALVDSLRVAAAR